MAAEEVDDVAGEVVDEVVDDPLEVAEGGQMWARWWPLEQAARRSLR